MVPAIRAQLRSDTGAQRGDPSKTGPLIVFLSVNDRVSGNYAASGLRPQGGERHGGRAADRALSPHLAPSARQVTVVVLVAGHAAPPCK